VKKGMSQFFLNVKTFSRSMELEESIREFSTKLRHREMMNYILFLSRTSWSYE